MSEDNPNDSLGGADRLPDERLTARCKECGDEIGAGYLCDECDTVEVIE